MSRVQSSEEPDGRFHLSVFRSFYSFYRKSSHLALFALIELTGLFDPQSAFSDILHIPVGTLPRADEDKIFRTLATIRAKPRATVRHKNTKIDYR